MNSKIKFKIAIREVKIAERHLVNICEKEIISLMKSHDIDYIDSDDSDIDDCIISYVYDNDYGGYLYLDRISHKNGKLLLGFIDDEGDNLIKTIDDFISEIDETYESSQKRHVFYIDYEYFYTTLYEKIEEYINEMDNPKE